MLGSWCSGYSAQRLYHYQCRHAAAKALCSTTLFPGQCHYLYLSLFNKLTTTFLPPPSKKCFSVRMAAHKKHERPAGLSHGRSHIDKPIPLLVDCSLSAQKRGRE